MIITFFGGSARFLFGLLGLLRLFALLLLILAVSLLFYSLLGLQLVALSLNELTNLAACLIVESDPVLLCRFWLLLRCIELISDRHLHFFDF